MNAIEKARIDINKSTIQFNKDVINEYYDILNYYKEMAIHIDDYGFNVSVLMDIICEIKVIIENRKNSIERLEKEIENITYSDYIKEKEKGGKEW